jgi:hypothetical protein
MQIARIFSIVLALVVAAEARPKRRSAERSLCVVGDKAPVAVWSYNAGHALNPIDWTGDHNGTLSGAAYTTAGLDGGAATYSGSDRDRMHVTDDADFKWAAGESMTLSMWINSDDNPFVPARLFSCHGIPATDRRLLIYTVNGGTDLNFAYRNSDGDYHIYTTSAWSHSANTWSHYVVTFTWGTGASFIIYQNGSPVAGAWGTGDGNEGPVVCAATIYIGNQVTKSFSWDGEIDNIGVYRSYLSAAEVAELYQRGKAEEQ